MCLGIVTTSRYIYITTSGVPASFDPSPVVSAIPFLVIGSCCAVFKFRSASALFNALGLILVAFAGAWSSSALIVHTGRHFPIVDRYFADADRLLGFDWLAWLRWFDQHPVFDGFAQVAYHSILVQPLAIVAALVCASQFDRLHALFLAMVGGLILTTLVALPLPAFGPYEYFGVTPLDHPHISLITEAKMTAPIQWLREANFQIPSPPITVGLISFPSYHATCAIIYLWALWQIPVLRWIGLGLNGLMLVATPVHGSHYLVDLIAGAAIALACIWTSMRTVHFVQSLRRSRVESFLTLPLRFARITQPR